MPTCKKCGAKVGLLTYDLSSGNCSACQVKDARQALEAAEERNQAAYERKAVVAEAAYPKAWRDADKEQFENSPLYRELRRQTEAILSIKTMLVWVFFIIPLILFVLGLVLGLFSHHS